MKPSPPFLVPVSILAIFATLLTSADAQNAPLPAPPGGFERPLASTPRRGNPGASPTLTITEFKALLAHWADFDANKNAKLEKTETPELFAKLFDGADANHDGALDEKERAAVQATSPPAASTTPQRPAGPMPQRRGPGPDPLRRAVFGPPLPGTP